MNTATLDTIRVRTSCRAYVGHPLSEKDRAALSEYIREETCNPFALRVRLQIIDTGKEGKIGTYGMITGAKTYLCGAVEKAGQGLAAYGYVMEKVILKATAMGIGTCWLGGTFTRSPFAKAIGLAADEWLPAVTPLGYPKKAGLRSYAIRAVAGADKRKSWNQLFCEGSLAAPLTPEAAGAYAAPLEAVRMGPSAVNKQPWRVVRDGEGYHFYSAGRGGAGPEKRHDHIDLGIALCHFELVARERGLSGGWKFAEKKQPGLAYIGSWIPA